MINMIKAENYRIFRSLGLYIGIGIMLLMIGISLFLCEPGSISMNLSYNGKELVNELDSPINNISYDELTKMNTKMLRDIILNSKGYQLDRDMLRSNMNLYYIFIFIAVIVITSDFSLGAIKNTLSSAISRKKYFISKTLYVLVFCSLILFANTYLCYFGNLIFNGGNLSSSLWIMTRTTLLQWPVILALSSILIGIAFAVRKTSIFNVISIIFGISLPLVYSMVMKLLDIDSIYIKYVFERMLSNLAEKPSISYTLSCYVICGIVIIVSTILGWLCFKKSEIN